MHHKFFIFGCNKEKTAILWTSSWNCTVRGTQHNNENVVVFDDQMIIKQYLEKFTQLRDKLIA